MGTRVHVGPTLNSYVEDQLRQSYLRRGRRRRPPPEFDFPRDLMLVSIKPEMASSHVGMGGRFLAGRSS